MLRHLCRNVIAEQLSVQSPAGSFHDPKDVRISRAVSLSHSGMNKSQMDFEFVDNPSHFHQYVPGRFGLQFRPMFSSWTDRCARSFIAIEDALAFVICRNQIFHESESFLLLDRINRWAPLIMYRSETHPIPLLEVIDQTGGTIEFWEFF
jgi:hypothetical protein